MKRFNLIGVPQDITDITKYFKGYAEMLSLTSIAENYIMHTSVIESTTVTDKYPSDICISIYEYDKFTHLVKHPVVDYYVLARELQAEKHFIPECLKILSTHNVYLAPYTTQLPQGGIQMTEQQVLEQLQEAIMKVPVGVAADVNKRIGDWFELGGKETDKYILNQIKYLNSVAQSL